MTRPWPLERGEDGKFSRAPRRLGSPARPLSLKNTVKGVPDGFFLTQICIKSIFDRGTPLGKLKTLPHTPSEGLVGW